MSDRRHFVYEAWMGEVCLYIGVTSNVKKRMQSHRSTSGGWPKALTRLDVTAFADRAAAEAHESRRIRESAPANNRRGIPRAA